MITCPSNLWSIIRILCLKHSNFSYIDSFYICDDNLNSNGIVIKQFNDINFIVTSTTVELTFKGTLQNQRDSLVLFHHILLLLEVYAEIYEMPIKIENITINETKLETNIKENNILDNLVISSNYTNSIKFIHISGITSDFGLNLENIPISYFTLTTYFIFKN